MLQGGRSPGRGGGWLLRRESVWNSALENAEKKGRRRRKCVLEGTTGCGSS